MRPRFTDTCDQVLHYKDHREPLVRRAVVELIPTLASYNVAEFTAHYLHRCMVHLIEQLRKDRDRTTSFYAIGHVALSVKQNMFPYLDAILASIKETLSSSIAAASTAAQRTGTKKSSGAAALPSLSSEASIFQCLSMLATAVGKALTKHMHELLELMFAFGLSESLRAALVDLAHHIPPLLPMIQGASRRFRILEDAN